MTEICVKNANNYRDNPYLPFLTCRTFLPRDEETSDWGMNWSNLVGFFSVKTAFGFGVDDIPNFLHMVYAAISILLLPLSLIAFPVVFTVLCLIVYKECICKTGDCFKSLLSTLLLPIFIIAVIILSAILSPLYSLYYVSALIGYYIRILYKILSFTFS